MYNYKINIYSVETTKGTSWIARFPEVFNTGGSGETPALAIEDAYKNLQFELECLREEGAEIPKPNGEMEFSGKFLTRISKSLHKKLVDAAEEEGVSLNQYVSTVLSEHIGERGGIKKAFSKVNEKYVEYSCARALGRLKFVVDFDDAIHQASATENYKKLMSIAEHLSNATNYQSSINRYVRGV